MKRADICTIIKDVASHWGYEYNEEADMIYLSNEDDVLSVLCDSESPQAIHIFSPVFDLHPSFSSEAIANLINKMNAPTKYCCYIITGDLNNRDDEQIPIIIKSELYALSKSHLRKSLPIILESIISNRNFAMQCCKDAMTQCCKDARAMAKMPFN